MDTERTWKPRAAAILIALAGLLALVTVRSTLRAYTGSEVGVPIAVVVVLWTSALGAYSAWKRGRWGWALAGAILPALIAPVGAPLGIPAALMLLLSKGEFLPGKTRVSTPRDNKTRTNLLIILGFVLAVPVIIAIVARLTAAE